MADRWHLLKNLKEGLQKLIEQCSVDLRKASRAIEEGEKQKIVEAQEEQNKQPPKEKKKSQASRYSLIFAEVKALFAQGMGKKTIANRLSISKNTVKRYLLFDEYPQKSLPTVKPGSARNYYHELKYHWDQGEKSPKKLWELLKQKGYPVSDKSVYYVISQFPGFESGSSTSTKKKVKFPKTTLINWNVRKVSRLLLNYQDEMKAKEYKYIKALCKIQPKIQQARQLAIEFRNILAERKGEKLSGFIESCQESEVGVLMSFGKSIKKDFDAVKAAATYDWSNGPVEGQVNRLKNIKRQMYGRAGFNLLKIRVLDSS